MKLANFVGKISLVSVICFLLTIYASFAQENEEQQIKTTYQEYLKSLKKHNGTKALQYIDDETIIHYDTIWKMFQTADSIQVANLPFTDMMTILNFCTLPFLGKCTVNHICHIYKKTYLFSIISSHSSTIKFGSISL